MQGEKISRGGTLGEINSKKLVKTRLFSTDNGEKLEGSMSCAKSGVGEHYDYLCTSGVGEAFLSKAESQLL